MKRPSSFIIALLVGKSALQKKSAFSPKRRQQRFDINPNKRREGFRKEYASSERSPN
jgi:hypothetical protein